MVRMATFRLGEHGSLIVTTGLNPVDQRVVDTPVEDVGVDVVVLGIALVPDASFVGREAIPITTKAEMTRTTSDRLSQARTWRKPSALSPALQ